MNEKNEPSLFEDDNFADLERELANLKPASPSLDLQARLESATQLSELEPVNDRKMILLWGTVIGSAMAACLLLLLQLRPNDLPRNETSENPVTPTQDSPAKGFRPLRTETVVIDAKDQGIVVTPNQIPVRQVRFKHINSVTLLDPETKATIIIQQPGESLLSIPVEIY